LTTLVVVCSFHFPGHLLSSSGVRDSCSWCQAASAHCMLHFHENNWLSCDSECFTEVQSCKKGKDSD